MSFLLALRAVADTAEITIQAGQPGHAIPSTLWGIFFEEINNAGDGGIYAELVRNRSFEDPERTNFWQLIRSGTASGSMLADTTLPVSVKNPTALQITFNSGTGEVGAANGGWWGMNFQAGQTYDLKFYARASSGFVGGITARLESASGSQVYAATSVGGLSTSWQLYSMTLVPSTSDTTGRLALVLSQPGTVWVDVVSLFPRATFQQRTNGLRPDLANVLGDIAPAFMRFPGGSWVNGVALTNAQRWKDTIGNLGDRPTQFNLWGYYADNGLGYHEYLQMCEDLHTEPLFVINCGMSVFWNEELVPLGDMGPWAQDAVDAIEYANGPTNSTWGSIRAANGHPAPFNLKFIQIGNENGGTAYNDRYALFYDAIKAAYPDVHIVACDWGSIPSSRPVEIQDEHYYNNPGFFIANANKYDSYSRSGPKVYVGEYAVTSGNGNGNLLGALAEAVFMTGLERNSDVVTLSSYAPLFANLNNKAWNPDLIYFDSSRVCGTPSYYVQKLFARNTGDAVLPVNVVLTQTDTAHHGAIGLGAWNTQVQYTNIVVTSNSSVLYQSDFTGGAAGWQVYKGTWNTSGGLYQQTANTTDCRSTTGNTGWSDYTVTLRARKTGGSEGFLILFNWLDDNNYTWWNLGGWNNTLHAIETSVNGVKTIVGSQVAGQIQLNQWYDIRIELSGSRIRCYLDNVLVHDVNYPDSPHGNVGLGTWNTRASFTNMVVAKGAQTLYQSDFTSGASGWQVYNGTWSTSGGLYSETASATDCRSTTGDATWADYTLSLRARKDSGNEGFLIIFNRTDDQNYTWWNLGGWNNTQHAIEQSVAGSKSIVGSAVSGSIQSGVWYDIRVELSGSHIRCYLNNSLVHDVSYPVSAPMYATASYATNSGQIILKTVNVSAQPINSTLKLNGLAGLASTANLTVLTGSPTAENTLAQPDAVIPVTSTLTGISTNFIQPFPANSLTVMRLQLPPALPTVIQLATGTNQVSLTTLSNGIPVRLSSFITNTVAVDYLIETPTGVLTNSTLAFVPGDLVNSIPIPATPPGGLLRVTLSHPVNGVLGSVARGYFVEPPAAGTDLRIDYARFADETIVYWADQAATLWSSTNVLGPWTQQTNTLPPLRIPGPAEREFYRVRK